MLLMYCLKNQKEILEQTNKIRKIKMQDEREVFNATKRMIYGLRQKISNNPLPDGVTKIQHEKNQVAKDAQLEVLGVVIKGMENIENRY